MYKNKNKKTSAAFWSKFFLIITVTIIVMVWYEIRFSGAQSWLLADYSKDLYTTVEPGSSDNIIFPKYGPFNIQRGYTRIPQFIESLEAEDFRIKEQSSFSPRLLKLVEHGIAPPYREPSLVGLKINDRSGKPIFDSTANTPIFESYTEIPELIVKTLLFLEDRQLAVPAGISTNPAVDWSRLSRASILYGIGQLGIETRREGGSTLATQLEKFRYSPQGITGSPVDKLRQMVSASIKAYSAGGDTRLARENIVVDYVNSLPLSATPNFGEVNGLANGLYAWFGTSRREVDEAFSAMGPTQEKLTIYKQALTLLISIRAPSYFLHTDYSGLQQRVNFFINLLQEAHIINSEFARLLREIKVPLNPENVGGVLVRPVFRKAVNQIRSQLSGSLGIPGYYQLNRLFLETDTSIDAELQSKVMGVFKQLEKYDFITRNKLNFKRLLDRGDPSNVLYSFLLYEKTTAGNALRVQADNFPSSFDINTDVKLDLGSTAKLRTLVHYLEVVNELYESYRNLDQASFRRLKTSSLDPISRWVMNICYWNKEITIDELLSWALERKYSANPGERFFTGGGTHHFQNFDPKDNTRRISVKQATVRSVNLVFIRLMEDLVKYHRTRLNYDAEAVISDKRSFLRRAFLEQSAEEEAGIYLRKFYRKYKGKSPNRIVNDLLQKRAKSKQHLAILYFAWTDAPNFKILGEWLTQLTGSSSGKLVDKIWSAYRKTYFDLSDYGYLLDKHPLEVWVAGQMIKTPDLKWERLYALSEESRRVTSQWLFKTRNSRAQNRRLNIRIERDAFARMALYWQRLGYPFGRLTPSYATAIGASSDRPVALAELVGIIINKGIKRPDTTIERLRFAEGTPYHTGLEKAASEGERVLAEPVANVLYNVLQGTVERGTAVRIRGAFNSASGKKLVVGGKTGSGDNRIKRVDKQGSLISSVAVNRTATFTFFIDDRFFGVITAHVSGPESEQYGFTSSLPVAVLGLLAPDISKIM